MTKIYENKNGYITKTSWGSLEVYKKSARNLDGWYDVSVNHVYTIYDNGYVRNQYLGKMDKYNFVTYDDQIQFAISILESK